MNAQTINFLRYPGGKQRLLAELIQHLPERAEIPGRFVEPFVGGAAIFFALNPKKALLTDVNKDLIDLYRGIRKDANAVWRRYQSMPSTKKGYYQIRDLHDSKDLIHKSARTLYLNRTCFKGMWRQNSNGKFNVGYGGQDRRWVVTKDLLLEAASRLRRASLIHADFEDVLDTCSADDFIFSDPPYKPNEREMSHDHYVFSQFTYSDHKRLAKALKRATRRGIKWAMTTSSHPDILLLHKRSRKIPIKRGTGSQPGLRTDISGEVLVCNY